MASSARTLDQDRRYLPSFYLFRVKFRSQRFGRVTHQGVVVGRCSLYEGRRKKLMFVVADCWSSYFELGMRPCEKSLDPCPDSNSHQPKKLFHSKYSGSRYASFLFSSLLTLHSCREKGVTAPFLATRGRSSLERSSRERYVLRRQKLAHSRTRPCSLSSALVLGLLDLDAPAPIAESDLAACCVWLSEGGPVERPARRPRGGDESPVGCLLLDRRRSRDADFRLGERSWPCDPEDLRRVPGVSAECDERRLLPLPSRRGEGEAVSSPTSNISLPESSSSLSLKMPSKLGRSAEASTLFFRVTLPPALPLLPLLLL